MTTAPPPISKKKKPKTPKMPPKPAAPSKPTRQAKTFSTAPWDGAGEGEKIIIYGASGRGKTTLATLAPAPIFLGLDDGGRKIRHPETGEPVQHVPGVETFDDVRDALHQPGLFDAYKSIVIDTGTALELLAMAWVIENVPHENGNAVIIKRIEDYGYGKGYQHMFDTMRLAFQDMDGQIRQGRNIILLCQECPQVIANTAGSNYLCNGPKLYAPGPESRQVFTTRGFACEWADHVFKVDYLQQSVVGARVDKKTGKEFAGKVYGTTERAIVVMPDNPSYVAKTRTLVDPVISFESPADDSLWQLLFPEEYA